MGSAANIAVDELRAQSFIEQMIDIAADVLIGNRPNRDVQPMQESHTTTFSFF